MSQVIFHGGCHGCTQQEQYGTDFCYDCQYFEADWSKPNLSNEVRPDDIERVIVKARREGKKPVSPLLTLVTNIFRKD